MALRNVCSVVLTLFVASAAFAQLSNITAEATGPAGTVVTFPSAGGPDDENGRPTGSCTPASGSLFPLGTTNVQCTNGSFQVTVTDTQPPVLSLPSGISARANGSDGAVVQYNASAFDVVDGAVAIACAPASGSLFPIGTTTVQCSASDSRANSSTGSFNVTVSEPPTAPPPPVHGDITAEATGPDGAIVTYSVTGGAEDADGRPATSCSPASGSRFPLGTTNVQCSDSTSFRVNVVDTTAPQLQLPRSFTVEATSSDGAIVTYEARATDLVDNGVGVTCAPASGSLFPTGTTTVQCSASDTRANIATGSFDVTVREPATPPPAGTDLTVEAMGPNGAIVTFNVSGGSGDDENGRPISGCAPSSGSVFPLGTTVVRCANGTTFKVNVVDTTPPALSLPTSITTPATRAEGAAVTFPTSANDLVDGTVAVTCAPASGSTFPIGSTLVTCSARDARANIANGDFTVTVTNSDTEAPVIVSLTAMPDVISPPNGKMVTVTLTAEVTDDQDPAPLVRIFDVTSNEDITGDWTITGPLTVDLLAERDSQGAGRVYAVHVEAIDAAGNRSTSAVNITVPHDQSSQPATIVPAPKRRAAGRR